MKGFDYDLLTDRHCIAINSQMFFLKNYDWLVFSDEEFWNGTENLSRKPIDVHSLKCKIICSTNARLRAGRNISVVKKVNYWSTDLETGVAGPNSGAYAISLAYIAGAKRIFLLGMDSGFIENERHHYDSVWTYSRGNDPNLVGSWKGKIERQMGHLKNVFNLSEQSRLKCYPKISIQQALEFD